MKEFNYVVNDPLGLHARPAGMLAKAAKEFADTTITITKGPKTVKATQLMMIMGLAVKNGDQVTVTSDDAAAVEKIAALIEQNLDEE